MESGIISGERSISYEEFMGETLRAASALGGLGIGPGDAVSFILRNDPAACQVFFAANALGAYAVPINWHYAGDEVKYIVTDSAAKAVVIHADLLPRFESTIPKGVEVVVVETPKEVADAYGIEPARCGVPKDRTEWYSWIAGHPMWSQTGGESLKLTTTTLYTSGTTGKPKGVQRWPGTPEQTQQTLDTTMKLYGVAGPVRSCVTTPIYHGVGLAASTVAILSQGLLVIHPRFDAERLLADIEKYRLTHLAVVPTLFVRLLKLPKEVKERYDVSSLQVVTHAAAPCAPSVKRKMIDWWGPVIQEFYGCTESGPVTFCDSAEWLSHPGTVGRVVENAVVRVFDDSGAECAVGEPGEIYSKLLSFGDFTYKGHEQARVEVEREGLITCGDVGYLDDDGYLYLCDRKRDMVISGGANIYPAEIEAVLLEMAGVRDCAVFGIPDEEFGESLMAVVEPDDGVRLNAGGVQEFLRTRLAKYKVPKTVEFRDDLPRDESGKLYKRRLRDPYWEKAGRAI